MQELTKFRALLDQAAKAPFKGRLLAVDPGETSGITIIDHCDHSTFLACQDQLACWPLEAAVSNLHKLISDSAPTHLVLEAYHVYKWRLREHTFSEVPTIQIIGCLKTWAIHFGVPYTEQTAQLGKGFFSDNRLKSLDMFIPGEPHARDSLRHAAHYLLFHQ